MQDKSVMIKTREGKRTIHVDEYTDNEIWISIQLSGGSASTSMTVAQAKQLIDSLTALVEEKEVA